jgi:hypothetical protein
MPKDARLGKDRKHRICDIYRGIDKTYCCCTALYTFINDTGSAPKARTAIECFVVFRK